jgi:hypothetical protein
MTTAFYKLILRNKAATAALSLLAAFAIYKAGESTGEFL